MIGGGMITPNIHDGQFQKWKTNKANSLLYNMEFSTCGARGKPDTYWLQKHAINERTLLNLSNSIFILTMLQIFILVVGVRAVGWMKNSNIEKSSESNNPRNQLPWYLGEHWHRNFLYGGREIHQSKVEGKAQWIHHSHNRSAVRSWMPL